MAVGKGSMARASKAAAAKSDAAKEEVVVAAEEKEQEMAALAAEENAATKVKKATRKTTTKKSSVKKTTTKKVSAEVKDEAEKVSGAVIEATSEHLVPIRRPASRRTAGCSSARRPRDCPWISGNGSATAASACP